MAGIILVILEAVTVIVGEFFSSLNAASGIEPDSTANDLCLTIGNATMVQESGQIPIDTPVNSIVMIKDKEVDVLLIQFGLGLSLGELRPDVLDNALAGSYVDPRKAPQTMDLGLL